MNQDVEDTRTYRGQILDRYSYLSQFRSGISDWSARMDFDFTPAPEHHIKFGAEYIHHTFRPGISTSKTQEVENGEQEAWLNRTVVLSLCREQRCPYTGI